MSWSHWKCYTKTDIWYFLSLYFLLLSYGIKEQFHVRLAFKLWLFFFFNCYYKRNEGIIWFHDVQTIGNRVRKRHFFQYWMMCVKTSSFFH